MKAIDSTNDRDGRAAIRLASAGVQKKRNMKREEAAKRDTDDVNVLPKISG